MILALTFENIQTQSTRFKIYMCPFEAATLLRKIIPLDYARSIDALVICNRQFFNKMADQPNSAASCCL